MNHTEKSFARERCDAKTKARSVAAIETALRDMDSMVIALDRYIGAEERRTRITDVKHAAYSTAAMAARLRSDNLKKSVIELKTKLRVATAEHNSSLAELADSEKGQHAAQSSVLVSKPGKQPKSALRV